MFGAVPFASAPFGSPLDQGSAPVITTTPGTLTGYTDTTSQGTISG